MDLPQVSGSTEIGEKPRGSRIRSMARKKSEKECALTPKQANVVASAQKKNLHLCRADAFENPLFSVGASCSDFGSHYKVGLQAPNKYNFGSLRVLHRFVKSDVRLRTPQRFQSRCRLSPYCSVPRASPQAWLGRKMRATAARFLQSGVTPRVYRRRAAQLGWQDDGVREG